MGYKYPQATGLQKRVKSSCKSGEKPISYAESMRVDREAFRHGERTDSEAES